MYGTAEQPIRMNRRKPVTKLLKQDMQTSVKQHSHSRGSPEQPWSTRAQTSDVIRTTSSYYDPDYSYDYDRTGPDQVSELILNLHV
jgi:hypothetical protein